MLADTLQEPSIITNKTLTKHLALSKPLEISIKTNNRIDGDGTFILEQSGPDKTETQC